MVFPVGPVTLLWHSLAHKVETSDDSHYDKSRLVKYINLATGQSSKIEVVWPYSQVF